MEMWNFALITSNGHFALCRIRSRGTKTNRLHQQANILSFLGPTTSSAIQQCVLYHVIVFCKGPFVCLRSTVSLPALELDGDTGIKDKLDYRSVSSPG